MDCNLEIYVLRCDSLGNILKNLWSGWGDTKYFLHAPGMFLIGPIESDVNDNYRLHLNRDILYVNSEDERKFLEELEKKLGMRFKRSKRFTPIKIGDDDIEEIRKRGGKSDQERDHLNKIISKYSWN